MIEYVIAVIVIVLMFIIGIFVGQNTKSSKIDGELIVFSDDSKDTYRFVVYQDIDSIPFHKTVTFQVMDVRDKNKDNNENFRKEDIL